MWSDHLFRNSFFITLSTATMGGFGFLFWLVGARLFTPDQIGLGTTLISSTVLISYLSLLGVDVTFVRFLPESDDRDAEINTGLVLVLLAALAVGAAYIIVAPLLVPALGFVQHTPILAVGFVVLTAFSAVNLVTDSVFIAYRAAKYNFIVDGLLQSGAKLALVVAFTGLGAYGIFAASGVAAVAAVGLSLFFMARGFAYRPKVQIARRVVRRVFAFSSLNYLANLVNIAPILLLPLIVINVRGPSQAGYYFIAFQIANLLNAVTYAVSQALFAEGSYASTVFAPLVRRSAKLLALTVLPASAFLALTGHWLLLAFGAGYSSHSTVTLVIFAASCPAVALKVWTSTILRLKMQLAGLIWSNVIYLISICGLAALWAHRGLPWVAGAWLLGNLIAGGVGVVLLLLPFWSKPKDLKGAPAISVSAKP